VSKVRVQSFGISIDGYGAGPRQDVQNPLGVNGPDLMEWFFPTRVFRQMHGQGDGDPGVDNDMAEQSFGGSGPGFSGATCSAPFEVLGRTTAGRA
jgi:hypothetical protein